MRVLLVGGTGAIGRPLIPRLRQAGHEVFATTRREARTAVLAELGARPLILEALDRQAVLRIVMETKPEVIINQLTDLSAPFSPRRYEQWLESTNRLRTEGAQHLVEAALQAGTRIMISQSIAFAYAWSGDGLKDEDDPLIEDQPEFRPAVESLRALERLTLETPEIRGVVLRYGYLYGPATTYAHDGDVAQMVRKRRFPVIGAGTGCFSFVHVEDAAAGTVDALQSSRSGSFNIVDDDPAEVREWLPAYAEALGAPPPRRIPPWLARLAGSRFLAEAPVKMHGASNARARRELGFSPRWPSWRQGFREALG